MTVPNRSREVEGFPGDVRVLLADNETGTDKALDTVLRIAGFDVVTANDGEEALRLARNVGFDILVVDEALPVKSGLMVCEGAARQPGAHRCRDAVRQGIRYRTG